MASASEGLRAAAVRNNALWCDTVCRTHAIHTRFDLDVWIAERRTPPYYPDAVALTPSAAAEAILAGIDLRSPGPSVKDSFATLDLASAGFEVVHEAEWFMREPSAVPVAAPPDVLWAPVATPEGLADWASAWGADGETADLFRPALLDDPAVSIVAGSVGDRIVAGAIANVGPDGFVGLSNVFTTDGGPNGAWRGALGYLDRVDPALTVVGYAAGNDLEVARSLGCVPTGPLRIWLRAG